MSLHDELPDPNSPRKAHEWTRDAIDAAQCGLCNLADVQVTCAAGASRHDIANLRFRLHVKWGTTEVPLKSPLLPLNITAQDIADSFGCSPLDATAQRKSYRLWLVAINPRTGGFDEVITRNGGAVVVSPDDAPVRPWDCDPQHVAQVNAEFASYMTWRSKNAGRHHLTGQPWTAPEEGDEPFRMDGGDDGDGDDAAFAPPRPPQRFPQTFQAPQAFAQPVQGFPQAPQGFPQAPGFAPPFQAPQLPGGFAPQAFARPQSAADAELAAMKAELAEIRAEREKQARAAEDQKLADARAETERLRRELDDARRAPQKALGTTEIVSAFGGVVSALTPLLQHLSESAKATTAREDARRAEEERRREDARKEERAREEARKEEERRREEARREEDRRREEREEARREEARKEEAQREERRREEARRDEDKREERRREERAEAHKERLATLKAGGGPEGAMAEALAAVRAEIAELKGGGGKKDKGGILGAIREAREIASLFGGKTEALDAAAKAAETGDQNATLEIIDAVGERLDGPMKMLASEFMADRQARRDAAKNRRGGYVQRGSGLLAAKRARLPDGTETDLPDDMVLLNDGTMIPLASWGSYLASMQQVPQQVPQFASTFAAAPAFPQAPVFQFAAPAHAPMFAPPVFQAAEEPAQVAAAEEPAQVAPPQEAPEQVAPPQVEVIDDAPAEPAPRVDDGPVLDDVPEFTG